MKTFTNLFLYLIFISSLINIGIKAGWGYDPGIVGPKVLTIASTLIVGAVSVQRRD